MEIKVNEVVGSNIAISTEKGEMLLKTIKKALELDEVVTVNFEGISDLTTAFLNIAIGHLYNDYSGGDLNKRLRVKCLDDLDMYLVSQVIDRVKMNKKKEDEFTNSIREVLDDGDDT